MSSKVVPFYQKRHKHYDHSYRNLQSRYVVQEYSAQKRSSSASTQKLSSISSGSRVKCVCGADRDVEEYYVPTFKKRTQELRSEQRAEQRSEQRSEQRAEQRAEQQVAYRSQQQHRGYDRSVHYSRELAFLEEDVRIARALAREQLDKVSIQRMVEEKLSLQRQIHEDCISRAPDILVRLRSHTVWEGMSVKLFFTVQGYPTPLVQWYKNESLISPASEPGKYRIESKYGVNSLEIYRTNIEDTGTYTAVARNGHGQSSTNSVVIVKRFRSEDEALHPGYRPHLPLTAAISFTHIDVKFLETFGVTFGVEGDTVTLSCSVLLTPDISRLRPQAEWYRDDVLIKESKWHQLHFGEGRASLTLTHLNKDDEGLYTVRMVTRGGVNQHSGFLFVADAAALVAGAPGAPMDVECYDANKDYVIVTWKPPNTASEAPVIGYFVDKCEVGTENWIQCNDSPVKICKYPVTGLFEGRSYIFRVRAVNKAGISRPSRVSVAVAALDPADLSRLQTIHLDGGREIVICQDDLEGDIKIPGPPTNVQALETSKMYVVLSWDPPVPRGRDPLVYYIEKTMVGSGSWQRVNSQIPVRSPRYAIFDLVEGKSYNFRVIAVNKHGVSEPSEVTPPIQAQERLAVPSAPGRILASRNTRTSVVVQFDRARVEEELIGYYIDSSVVGSNHWDHCNHKPIKYNRFVVHGLTAGEQYIFRVKAINAVGVSENSQESEPITVKAALTTPSSPYGITLLNCDGRSMTLGWKLPKFTGGANITGYYIDKRVANHLNWHEENSKQVQERLYKVENLEEGAFYEFKITASNLAGLGIPSDPSEHFICEAWTSLEPGPSYDLTFCEVRNTSLVILWKEPVYSGNSPVVGYFVEYKELEGEQWTRVNTTATSNRYLKVKELEEGKTYVFQIRAVNASGIGKPSDISEPVLVQARPGVQEITTGVDEEGNIYLAYNCTEISEASQFTWGKAYEEITEDQKFKTETIGENAKLYFKDPDKDDLGTYTVAVSDTDGISSSYVLEADELERLKTLSHEIRNPTIPLKSELAYEILEKGKVRFWMEAQNLSADTTFRFVVNDLEIKDSENHRIKFDRSTGMIEMVMERFTVENEGTYTVQLQDGKAKNQSSLVLIGDAFKALLAEAEFQRKEYIRKQGPHFLEYLYWEVTEECEVLLVCKVANIKKETVFKWYKEEIPTEALDVPDLQQGVCIFRIPRLTKKDQGEYKATLKDDRGQDISILELSGKVYEEIVLGMSKVSGSSASDLKIQCTPEGIRFHCFMKYFSEEMKVCWYQRESKISSSEKMRIGGTDEYAWLQICEPTEKDKGKYTFEIFDAKSSHKRTIDLSGQAFDEAYAEFQRLKAAAFAEKNRGKVIGGLPDVVTIMEGKTLSLTCTVFGNPDPEVTWLKNDRDLEISDHFSATLEQGKFSNLTIKNVTSEDSGKYGINVKNKYGGETVDITVSVYKHGEEAPEVKLGQLPKHAPSPAPAPAPSPAPATEKAKPAPKPGRSGRK